MRYIKHCNVGFLFLLLLFPFFFYGGPPSFNGRLFQEAWNLGHLLFFGFMAFILHVQLTQIEKSSVRRSLIIMLVVIGCAGAVEFIQFFLPGRYATMGDFLLGLAGGGGTLCLVYGLMNRNTLRIVFLLIGTSILSASLTPFALVVYDEFNAQRVFPALSDFESSLDVSRWSDECKVKRVKNPVRNGEYSLHIKIPPGRYPGISLLHFPQNWNQAKSLQFSVYNPGEPLMLNFRVHDATHEQGQMSYHDRFNGKQQMEPGWNTVTIPAQDIMNAPTGRQMNLEEIKDFRVFLVNNNENKVLYFDDVKLVLNN